MVPTSTSELSFERSFRAVDAVRDRLRRTVAALEAAGVPYSVIGGFAVQAWVGRVDEGAMRNTADVDVLLNRTDLSVAIAAMKAAGFIHYQLSGIEMFLDGPNAGPRQAVHVVLAGEKTKEHHPFPAPAVEESGETRIPEHYRVLTLGALVRMKLTSYRLKDKVHVIDMLDVGLIDAGWCDRLPPILAQRLREMIEEWKSEQYWPRSV